MKKILLIIPLIFVLSGCILPESVCIKHKDFELIQANTTKIKLGTINIDFRECSNPSNLQEGEVWVNITNITRSDYNATFDK